MTANVRFLNLIAVAAVSLLILAACGAANDDDADDREGGDPATTEAARGVAAPTSTPGDDPTPSEDLEGDEPTATPEIGPNGFYTEVQIDDDGEKHIVPWDRVMSGGPPKDGIPSIDEPLFAGSETWDALEYDEDGLVIGVEVNGERRAYPFQVLVWHEIVNDVIQGKPMIITYCPLCGTAIAFEREINGEIYEFGVSGLLYNSDLLMYDRTTDSLWSQITGEAVAGELTLTQLPFYPSEIMTWSDWKETYPDSVVLTKDTGHNRNYDQDPYGGYYGSDRLMFPANRSSDRFDDLFIKDEVIGVEVDGGHASAYPVNDVIEHGPVNDVIGDVPVIVVANPNAGSSIVVFERRVDGQELTFSVESDVMVDAETGTTWNFDGVAVDGELEGSQLTEIIPVRGFWFAWAAFHPDTDLWLPEESD